MKEYTIYFKNGLQKVVHEEIAKTIERKIIQGCNNFQTFSDGDNELICIINVSEIVFVEQLKDK